MKIPKKSRSEIEYTKFYLANIAKLPKCRFCKYNLSSYKFENTSLDNVNMNILQEHCHTCIYDELSKRQEWYRDNFKPLYNWEIED